jgi:predicted nucleic acid-binding protein
MAKGLTRAADELAALHFPATERGAANALVVQLRAVASGYRMFDHDSIPAITALHRHLPLLTQAAEHLRHVLGLPADKNAEFLQYQ